MQLKTIKCKRTNVYEMKSSERVIINYRIKVKLSDYIYI